MEVVGCLQIMCMFVFYEVIDGENIQFHTLISGWPSLDE